MKASARIHVALEMPIGETWPDGTDIAVIRKEAIDAGLRRLAEILRVINGPRVVGEPKVTIVLLEDV